MQRPAQGASKLEPELEAMKVASSAAINSNEKIFPVFAQKLSSGDFNDFAHTTRKLAVWLGSDRAYYSVARPRIVRLIEIARSTFINAFLHHPAAAEAADDLRKLIEAVTPFRHLFTESELQSKLQRAISDTNLSLSVVASSSTHNIVQSAVDTIIPTDDPPPAIPAASSVISQMQPPSAVQGVSDGHVLADVPQVPSLLELVSSTQVNAIQSPVLPVSNIPQDSENTSPTLPSKPQPKRARRVELSEELIARDLDWFKSQQGSVAVQDDPSPSASSSKPHESLPTLASDGPRALQLSPPLKKKTARMVPSRRLPRRALFNTTQEMECNASTSGHSSEQSTEKAGHAEDLSIHIDADEQSPSLERTCPETHPVGGLDHSSAPLPEARLDSAEPIDVSCSDLNSERLASEAPSKVGRTPLQPIQDLPTRSLILPPLVGALDPPLNLNFRPSQIHATQPQLEMKTNQKRFDGKIIVIHSTQGKPFAYTHTIDINLNESMYSKVSGWMNRKSHPSKAHDGVCISLACYHLPELFDLIKSESGELDVEELMLRSSCSWPRLGRMSLHVKDERESTIPLSPPIFLTSDQCVDVTLFMKPGKNTLEIRQQDDMSEYLIVFHAHPPTKAQLAEFEVVKIADERWKRFLDGFSAHVAPKTYGADVVGVF